MTAMINNIILNRYAKSVGSDHFNTSAKAGNNVMEIFLTLAESMNSMILMEIVEIVDASKNPKEDGQKKRKINTRGVLKVDGYTDFNPDMNVQLSRKTNAKKSKESSGGCCGGGKK